eukprot:UN33134
MEILKHLIGCVAMLNLLRVVSLALGGSETLKVLLESHTQGKRRALCSWCFEANNDYDLYYFNNIILLLIWVKPILILIEFLARDAHVDTYNTTISVFYVSNLIYAPILCIATNEIFKLLYSHAHIVNLDYKVIGILLQSVFPQFQSSLVNLFVACNVI